MRIANIMLSRGLGGIEQAFLDYAEGLVRAGHDISLITHPRAAVNMAIPALQVSHVTLSNLGQWDPRAPKRLAMLLRIMRAEVLIAHGSRSTNFACRAVSGRLPIIAVSHNYQFEHLPKADMVFATTRHMTEIIPRETGIPRDRVYHIPNMIRTRGGFVRHTWRKPPIIGTLGRFVAKKGFDTFLHAVWNLKQRGFVFRVVMGGSGEEEKSLKALVRKLHLEDHVHFAGWVDDPMQFLSEIDIFCLPSHEEPFGIVLLEAMSAKLPIVTTDCEGPMEIMEPGTSGLMVPRARPVELADALAELLADQDGARILGAQAYRHVKLHYDMDFIISRISEVLHTTQTRFAPRIAA